MSEEKESDSVAIMTIPHLEPSSSSEIEAVIMTEIEGGDGVYRPIIVADSSTEIELTIDDAERLHLFLTDALQFLEGRKLGLM